MATKGVVCAYQEVVDLHTEPDHVTVIGIHTPTGDTPKKMFRGFFDQYKKYKYLGASVSLVPAARLPADMLQVSYEAGDYIDPRDSMNPIMFHGCHGDDMGTILNRLYNSQSVGDSVSALDIEPNTMNPLDTAEYDQWERLYYKALTDNTWKKAHPQRGFRKSGLRPLIYQLATNHQLMPGSRANAMIGGVRAEFLDSVGSPDAPVGEGTYGTDLEITDPALNDSMFFTPRLTGLGWMDTRNVLTVPATAEVQFDASSTPQLQIEKALQTATATQVNYAQMPKLYMGVVLLSKMYKVAQYYRMIINHRFAFKDFRSISFMPEQSGVPSYFNANTDDGIFDPETFEDFQEGDSPEPPGPTPPEPVAGNLNITCSTTYSDTKVIAAFPYDSTIVGDGVRAKLVPGSTALLTFEKPSTSWFVIRVVNYSSATPDLDDYDFTNVSNLGVKINGGSAQYSISKFGGDYMSLTLNDTSGTNNLMTRSENP